MSSSAHRSLDSVVAGAQDGSTVRVRMLVAYDGSAFHGFAYQNPSIPTVAAALKAAITSLFGVDLDITCAGRTDTGVHAWGQVVHFDLPQSLFQRADAGRMQAIFNRHLAPTIVIRETQIVDNDFHARFSATARRYRYTVLNAQLPDPFRTRTTWWVPHALDLDAMNAAGESIVGERDFSSFCRRPDATASLTRNVHHAIWQRLDDDVVQLDIQASSFCHQMVRSLTGMFVAIGRSKRSVEEMASVLDARDRQKAASPAPPEGLCLWEVQY